MGQARVRATEQGDAAMAGQWAAPAVAAMGIGLYVARVVPDADGGPDLAILSENPAAARILGVTLAGGRLGDGIGDGDAWRDAAARTVRTDEPRQIAWRAADGRWLDVRTFRHDGQASDELYLLIDDVSDRRRIEITYHEAEDRRLFLLTLSDAIRSADTPRAMIGIVARAVRRRIDAGEVSLVEGAAIDGGNPDSPSAAMLGAGHAIRIDDIAARDIACPIAGSIDMAGARAVMAVPLLVEGRLVMTLVAHHDTPRHWTDDDVTLAQAAMERLWAALDRDRTDEALRRSERRLQTLVEGVPQLVWRATAGGCWTWSSPQWTAFTGQTPEQCAGWGWLDALHPDDRAGAREFWRQAERDGRMLEMRGRIRRASDGSYRWFQTRALPERDAGGQIVEWLGTTTDIDELRRLQDRQQALVGELQHRVRNILSVIRSVFGQTVASGRSLEEVVEHFKGRLDSLGRTQAVVAMADGAVDLENLIRDELLSVGASDGPQISIGGPEVSLPIDQAQIVGLAIHELTTNAVKFGALRIPGAKLDISWQTDVFYGETPKLNLKWQEQGVPTIAVSPLHEGFGRELIEEALPYRLGAETRLEFRGGGVCCLISLPLPDPGACAALV